MQVSRGDDYFGTVILLYLTIDYVQNLPNLQSDPGPCSGRSCLIARLCYCVLVISCSHFMWDDTPLLRLLLSAYLLIWYDTLFLQSQAFTDFYYPKLVSPVPKLLNCDLSDSWPLTNESFFVFRGEGQMTVLPSYMNSDGS